MIYYFCSASNQHIREKYDRMSSHFPACHVRFPAPASHRRAAFYLAAEEYVAQELPADNYLFSWQLAPSVVIGRNQVAHMEVDLDFCRHEGIDVVRRKSGGGAIFADKGNLMWSLVTGRGAVEPLFAEYAENVAHALRAIGAPATVSGRNDIVLDGKGKICGNAFYHLPGRNIVHGTMLYDTQARLMQSALRPDTSKLKAKGIKSTRSRIALLKDYVPYGIDTLRDRLCALLTNRSIELEERDLDKIEKMEKPYCERAWLYGQASGSDTVRTMRIEGCGKLSVHFFLRGSLIADVALSGDFFELEDATSAFRHAFAGLAFTPQSLRDAIATHHPEKNIRNLTEAQLFSLLDV